METGIQPVEPDYPMPPALGQRRPPVSTGTLLGVLIPMALLGAFLWLQSRNTELRAATLPPNVAPEAEFRTPPRLGTKAPVIRVRDAAGGRDLRPILPGKPSLVAFVPMKGGLCSVFSAQFQPLATLRDRYADRGVAVSVVTDVPFTALREKATEHGVSIPIFADESGRGLRAYGVEPGDFLLFLIDSSGEIAFWQTAPIQSTDSPLTTILDEMTTANTSKLEMP